MDKGIVWRGGIGIISPYQHRFLHNTVKIIGVYVPKIIAKKNGSAGEKEKKKGTIYYNGIMSFDKKKGKKKEKEGKFESNSYA